MKNSPVFSKKEQNISQNNTNKKVSINLKIFFILKIFVLKIYPKNLNKPLTKNYLVCHIKNKLINGLKSDMYIYTFIRIK